MPQIKYFFKLGRGVPGRGVPVKKIDLGRGVPGRNGFGPRSPGTNGSTPKKKHLTHPQAELGLSHMWPVGGSNLQATPVTAVSNLNSLLVKRQIDNPSPDQLVCHHNFKVKEKSREESESE